MSALEKHWGPTVQEFRGRRAESAQQAFARVKASVEQDLKSLKGHIEKLAKDAAKNPLDWGYPGSMGHIHEVLSDLNSGHN